MPHSVTIVAVKVSTQLKGSKPRVKFQCLSPACGVFSSRFKVQRLPGYLLFLNIFQHDPIRTFPHEAILAPNPQPTYLGDRLKNSTNFVPLYNRRKDCSSRLAAPPSPERQYRNNSDHSANKTVPCILTFTAGDV